MTYYVEFTDLFCGELNYCFAERYLVEAKDLRQAISKFSKQTGRKGARKQWSQGEDSAVYHYGKSYGVSIEWIDSDDLSNFKDTKKL